MKKFELIKIIREEVAIVLERRKKKKLQELESETATKDETAVAALLVKKAGLETQIANLQKQKAAISTQMNALEKK